MITQIGTPITQKRETSYTPSQQAYQLLQRGIPVVPPN